MVERKAAADSSELARVAAGLRGWLVAVAGFSGLVNLLALTGSLFMLQVYDRVLSSRSVPTLVALFVIVVGLYLVQGLLDLVRGRMLVRLGTRVEELLGERTYGLVLRLPLRHVAGKDAAGRDAGGRDGGGRASLQPVADLDAVRGFLAGPGLVALLDLPWMPIYLAFVFLLHPLLGWLATGGAGVLILLTLATELLSRAPAKAAFEEARRRGALTEAGRRNAEVLRAMGFADRLAARWLAVNRRYLRAQQRAGDVTGGLGALSKVWRALLQSAILGLGAWLTIQGELSPGAIIASSIASSRCFAPVEQAIANWRPFLAARAARRRLDTLFRLLRDEPEPMSLPAPRRLLAVEGLAAGAPGQGGSGQQAPLIQNISFRVEAGQALGVVGPSAAGKSTLARALVGAWPILRGSVRLDGAALDQWGPAALGRHVGYLPQDIELFDGSVAENIARFEPEAPAEAIVAAARAAGVHELILRLPAGYETRIGEDGAALSGGQRQRIALARALYRAPFLIVLDEPNSNLDAEGEAALTQAILDARQRGAIVVLVAHRPSVIAAVDLLAVMGEGGLKAFGPKDEILRQAVPKPAPPNLTLASP